MLYRGFKIETERHEGSDGWEVRFWESMVGKWTVYFGFDCEVDALKYAKGEIERQVATEVTWAWGEVHRLQPPEGIE